MFIFDGTHLVMKANKPLSQFAIFNGIVVVFFNDICNLEYRHWFIKRNNKLEI